LTPPSVVPRSCPWEVCAMVESSATTATAES
jgi:hypothetical protein